MLAFCRMIYLRSCLFAFGSILAFGLGANAAAPTVAGIVPDRGTTAGGTVVTIYGGYFTGAKVTFDGAAATNIVVVNGDSSSSARITATTPPHPAGYVSVVVTTPSGQANVLFTYVAPAVPPPVVSSLSPNQGTTAGGTAVMINGQNFTGTTRVTFGGRDATEFRVLNPTTISAVTPPPTASTLALVEVTTPSGKNIFGPFFTYVSPAPLIDRISPGLGSTLGGTVVTITGKNFTGANSVTFGGVNAISFRVVNDTTLLASSPPHPEGYPDVRVVTAMGMGTRGFLYYDAPIPEMSINDGGIVNSASYSGSVVAPGGLASIFGSFPAVIEAQAMVFPWPTELSGISVRFNETPAPIYSVSAGQINLQVPWQMSSTSQARVIATIGGQSSAPRLVNIAGLAPGVFQYGSRQGIVTDAVTGQLISSTNPARPGTSYLTIYCTGLGAVFNQPETGAPASSSELAATVGAAAVTIGGVAAPVLYSGLAPGFVGLYQVNVQVPETASGDLAALVVSIDGKAAPAVFIPIRPTP